MKRMVGCKAEEHAIDGEKKQLFGGTMGTASYALAGTPVGSSQ